MKQVLLREGRAVVQEMPVPVCGDGEVLVRTAFSLISTGTETAAMAGSAPDAAGLRWTRRLKKAGEVARMVATRGTSGARAAIEARLEGTSHVTGYSLAGTVLEVGRNVRDLAPGQRVACAGASSAHHAEIVAVPRNLVVPVPEALPLDRACGVTLGAIALQGVRQADLRLGEIAFVTGLGLIGQITVALLAASGCRVFGADLDPARVERARGLGLAEGFAFAGADLDRAVDQATGGNGVDAVLLTAASGSSEPLRQAMRLVRRRGRVVVVGAVGLDLERGPFYMKEAELRISCSYGPGRYDPSYEDDGQDYPYGFVRWTENRNMEEFLRLASTGAVPMDTLLDAHVALDEAPAAYERLSGPGVAGEKPLAVVLRYPAADGAAMSPSVAPRRRVDVVPTPVARGLSVGLVGPGDFARNVHLPNLASLAPAAMLRAVAARTANAAREAARMFGAEHASTDLDEMLRDEALDAVLVCTRHDLHAAQAIRCLSAGKHVFLEKPAGLTEGELDALERAALASGRAFTVGFNRRCAPDVLALVERLRARRAPCVIDYRVNAGRLPASHWALGPHGGGRLIGEACHMLDLLAHLAGSRVVRHTIAPLLPPAGRGDLPLGDNVAVTLGFADGSLATLTYTSLGHAAAGKERIEVHWDGTTAVIDDFRALTIDGRDAGGRREAPDKGHREFLRRFVEHAAGRGGAPIESDEIFAVSRLALALDNAVRRLAPEAS